MAKKDTTSEIGFFYFISCALFFVGGVFFQAVTGNGVSQKKKEPPPGHEYVERVTWRCIEGGAWFDIEAETGKTPDIILGKTCYVSRIYESDKLRHIEDK